MTPRGMMLGAAALIAAGAAGATWLLTSWDGAAKLVGLQETQESSQTTLLENPRETAEKQAATTLPVVTTNAGATPVTLEELGSIEDRVARIEQRVAAAEGSAGRADALLVAFAARRAIERGVPLGYLEKLLVDRFGTDQQRYVAAVITAARDPVRLEDLVRRYEELGAVLRSGTEDPGLWDRFKREIGSIAVIYHADEPNPRPKARYDRALVELRLGNVSAALAETMRLPGAPGAADWVEDARRYIAVREALDRLESAALLSREENATDRIAG